MKEKQEDSQKPLFPVSIDKSLKPKEKIPNYYEMEDLNPLYEKKVLRQSKKSKKH